MAKKLRGFFSFHRKNVLVNIKNILFGISAASVTFVLSVGNISIWELGLTWVLSVIIYTIIDRKLSFSKWTAAPSVLISIISMVLALISMIILYQSKYDLLIGRFTGFLHYQVKYIPHLIGITMFPSLFLFYVYLCKGVKAYAIPFLNGLTQYEKISFYGYILISFVAMLYLNAKTSAFTYGWYINEDGILAKQSVNMIMNLDSGIMLDFIRDFNQVANVRRIAWQFLSIPLISAATLFSVVFPHIPDSFSVFLCLLRAY